MNELRAKRTAAGLSQEALAEQAECSQTHISQIEAGEKLPSGRLAARLETLLGIPAASWYGEASRCA
jgi:transcriptional regulator with XRE-family HTH domain